eukprot:COSAG02_NODE_51330_length_314_cov_11.995349_1_plen_65_part_01
MSGAIDLVVREVSAIEDGKIIGFGQRKMKICHQLQQLNTISQHSNITGIPREKETQPDFHSDAVT